MNGHINVVESIASGGRDSNYVLEGNLDTPEQDPEVDVSYGRFDRLVDAGRFEEADWGPLTSWTVLSKAMRPGSHFVGQMQAPEADVRVRGSAKGSEPKALRSWKEGQLSAGQKTPLQRSARGPRHQATRKALFLEQTGAKILP